MSIGTIQRAHEVLEFAIASGATTSNGVDVSRLAGGVLIVPSAYASNTGLVFHASDALDGTYVALLDAAGDAVGLTLTAARAFALPEEVFLCPFVKVVIGAAAAQAETLTLAAKS